jgi:DNA-binding NarL/FixJ family response regulator
MTERAEQLLEQLVRMHALMLTSEAKTQTEAAHVLLRAGLDTNRIAELLDTTPATVRAAKQSLGKKASRGGGAK